MMLDNFSKLNLCKNKFYKIYSVVHSNTECRFYVIGLAFMDIL